MSEVNRDLIVKALGKALETEIKFITLVVTKAKIKDKARSVDKKIIICFGRTKIFILLESLDSVKAEFEYSAIQKVVLDKNLKNYLRIHLDPLKYPKSKSFFLRVKDRGFFVKNLMCYYSIYYMKYYGIVCDLLIKERDGVLSEKGSNVIKGGGVIHNTPDGFIIRTMKKYEFFIKDCIVEEGVDYFVLKVSKKVNVKEVKENNHEEEVEKTNSYNVDLKIDIGEPLPIDRFQNSKDERDIRFYANLYLVNYIRNVEKCNRFWIYSNTYYYKRFNLGQDTAQWEGWRIDCRINEPKCINIVQIVLRRKFIPPFYDTYTDIVFMLKEPVDPEFGFDISEESNLLLETIADSIFPTNVTSEKGDYTNVLESKLEGLLPDEESIYYFYNILGIIGKETYKIALDYVYKFLTMLEDTNKEKIAPLKKSFEFKIINAYSNWKEKFDLENYEKTIIDRDLEYFTRRMEKLITASSSESSGNVKIIWENKMWRYLSFCLNGGLTNNLLNLQELINMFKKMSSLYSYHAQLNNLLNLRIITLRNEMLDPKISSVLNFMGDIKYFDYNEEVMIVMIKTGYLKILQAVENDMNYAAFIRFLLDNNPSIKLLNALAHYIKEISKTDGDNNLTDAGMRKAFNSILSSLMVIYSNGRLCPITIATACKCLVYLTCADSDKNNKNKILQEDALYIISQYLDFPEEKILFFSLELLQNLLSEMRENLHDILYKNNKLIPALLNLLKGPGIPGTKYSLKHINLAVTILINLIKMQNTLMKEKLSSEENRDFLINLKQYVEETKFDKAVGMDHFLNLQERIFLLLDHLIRKNFDLRRYMRDSLKFIDLIETKCGIIKEFVKFLIKAQKEVFMNKYGDILDPALKMVRSLLTFLFYYIGNDKEVMTQIQTECKNVTSLIQDIIENKTKEIINPLAESASSINMMLNPEENDDDEF